MICVHFEVGHNYYQAVHYRIKTKLHILYIYRIKHLHLDETEIHDKNQMACFLVLSLHFQKAR